MPIWGVDYSQGYDIATLQKWNAKFAVRYVGYTSPSLPQTKILTLTEARALSSAGIGIVSNWEWYNSRPSEGFAAGAWDAQTADALHKADGGPADRPIYFSVDYNSSGVETVGYFKGVASVIGLGRTGVYGGYNCVKFLYEQGLVKWVWQTYAWSGSNFYPANNIYQYANGMTLDNMTVDYDNAFTTDFGQWFIIQERVILMQKQLDDLWMTGHGTNLDGTSWTARKSGIYQLVLQAFLGHLIGACFPTTDELESEDWNNNPGLIQTLSNGFYAFWWPDNHGHIYDPYNHQVL